jgi:hypothetical protein
MWKEDVGVWEEEGICGFYGPSVDCCAGGGDGVKKSGMFLLGDKASLSI